MTTGNEQDILKRLHQLEEENARLRGVPKTKSTELVVSEGDYNGHPVLTFDGRGKRFSIGLKKLRAVQEAWPLVEQFLQRHKSAMGKSSDSDDDIQI
jgi:hypothetical protein